MSTLTPVFAKTVAHTGLGDSIFISVDSGTTNIQVKQTKNISYSGQKRNSVDITNGSSPDQYLESLPTMLDPGSIKFDMVFNPADSGQTALYAAYAAGTVLTVNHVFKAQTGYTTGAIYTFDAWVEECPLPGSDVTKATEISVSLKITAAITRTDPVAAA